MRVWRRWEKNSQRGNTRSTAGGQQENSSCGAAGRRTAREGMREAQQEDSRKTAAKQQKRGRSVGLRCFRMVATSSARDIRIPFVCACCRRRLAFCHLRVRAAAAMHAGGGGRGGRSDGRRARKKEGGGGRLAHRAIYARCVQQPLSVEPRARPQQRGKMVGHAGCRAELCEEGEAPPGGVRRSGRGLRATPQRPPQRPTSVSAARKRGFPCQTHSP